MTTNARQKDDHGLSQAKAQLRSIKEMVAALEAAQEADDDTAREQAETTIQEDALSVEVRSEWYSPGTDAGQRIDAAEYRILLCTGGPAVQIVGQLSAHGEPEKASLQYQDWFTPWTDLHTDSADDEALLTYAQQFWFGERDAGIRHHNPARA